MNEYNKEIRDKDFVENLIPQKAPFVMVDKLLHFEDQKIIAGLKVSPENIFTENNEFTAPGLIEHMAQSVALHTGYRYFLKDEDPPVGYLGAIKKIEIFRLPEIENELVTTVDILHDIMGVTLVKVETRKGNQLLASGEMKTVLA